MDPLFTIPHPVYSRDTNHPPSKHFKLLHEWSPTPPPFPQAILSPTNAASVLLHGPLLTLANVSELTATEANPSGPPNIPRHHQLFLFFMSTIRYTQGHTLASRRRSFTTQHLTSHSSARARSTITGTRPTLRLVHTNRAHGTAVLLLTRWKRGRCSGVEIAIEFWHKSMRLFAKSVLGCFLLHFFFMRVRGGRKLPVEEWEACTNA